MDLNRRPPLYKSGALTTELWAPIYKYHSRLIDHWQTANLFLISAGLEAVKSIPLLMMSADCS